MKSSPSICWLDGVGRNVEVMNDSMREGMRDNLPF